MRKTGTILIWLWQWVFSVRTGQVKISKFPPLKIGFIGELSLNASIRPVSGILPMVMKAKDSGIKTLFIARENTKEASLVKGMEIIGCGSIKRRNNRNPRGNYLYPA